MKAYNLIREAQLMPITVDPKMQNRQEKVRSANALKPVLEEISLFLEEHKSIISNSLFLAAVAPFDAYPLPFFLIQR